MLHLSTRKSCSNNRVQPFCCVAQFVEVFLVSGWGGNQEHAAWHWRALSHQDRGDLLHSISHAAEFGQGRNQRVPKARQSALMIFLSLIRATSLSGSARQAPGPAIARDHALLPSRDGRFVARARRA